MSTRKKTWIQRVFGIAFIYVFFIATITSASDLTSTNFIIRDPVVGTGGGYSSSSSFNLFSAGNTNLSGVNSSTSFIGHYGFLYYPFVNLGTLTAVQNGVNVDLSWPASTSGQGWSVSGYTTGVSNVAGGPYTYTSVGNVTSYSYTSVVPGYYCYVVQTIDALGYVIGTSNESCITVQPIVSLSISNSSVGFGSLTTANARYATTSGGTNTSTVAHTITTQSNGSSGYTLTYSGPTLTSGVNTIAAATITGDADGTPGTGQFALSLSTSGTATIPSAYDQSSNNWKFVPNTTSTIASTTSPLSSETFSLRYLANSAQTTPAGTYTTNITYILTGNF